MEQTNIIDLGKVGITVEKKPWSSSTFYERLTMVHHKESGNTYVSVEDNVNRDPSKDDGSNWILSSMNGMSIYELMVARGKYSGTEEQFLADYNKAVSDAKAAATTATTATTAALAAANDANEAKVQAAAATELCENATAAATTATTAANTAAANAASIKTALDNFIEQGGGATDAQVIKNTGDISQLALKNDKHYVNYALGNKAIYEMLIEGTDEQLYIYALFVENTRTVVQIVNNVKSLVIEYIIPSKKTGIKYVKIQKNNITISMIVNWDVLLNASAIASTYLTEGKIDAAAYNPQCNPTISFINKTAKDEVSKNNTSLVSGGVVYDAIEKSLERAKSILSPLWISTTTNAFIDDNGNLTTNSSYTANTFLVTEGQKISVSGMFAADKNRPCYAFYNGSPSSSTLVSISPSIPKSIYEYNIVVPSGCDRIVVIGLAGDVARSFFPNDEYVAPMAYFNKSTDKVIEDLYSKIGADKVVNCVGDSLTMGAADIIGGTRIIHPYSNTLQSLLGNDYVVKNQGIGGEGTLTAAARMNGIVALTENDITIPYNKSWVNLSSTNLGGIVSSWDKTTNLKPLLQGTSLQGVYEIGQSFRGYFVWIKGIRCWLTCWDGGSPYKIVRVTDASNPNENVFVPKGTPIIFERTLHERNSLCDIIWLGTNDANKADVISKIKAMLDYRNNNNAIVIGLYNTNDMPNNMDNDIRIAFSKEFGNRYFNVENYLLYECLSECGITPTSADTAAINIKRCPPSLLADNVHLISAAYDGIARRLHMKMMELGIIEY